MTKVFEGQSDEGLMDVWREHAKERRVGDAQAVELELNSRGYIRRGKRFRKEETDTPQEGDQTWMVTIRMPVEITASELEGMDDLRREEYLFELATLQAKDYAFEVEAELTSGKDFMR